MIVQWINEFISLSVLSVARDMIAQWMNECIALSVLSRPWRGNSKDLSLVDHTLPTHSEPVWQKMAQSPLNRAIQPVDIEKEGGQSQTTVRQ